MGGLRAQVSDIRRGARAVGVESHLYRPPYGHESFWTRPAAWFLGYRLVYWSVSPKDWHVSCPEVLADRIRAGLRPGEVVLLHDRLRHATDVAAFDRGYLVQAVVRVLSEADEKIRFVTVPELVAAGRPIVRHRHRTSPPLAPMFEQPA
jgi:peptidoglycan/xylan/chitin deacetylase (PgdA/CDA1 family)